MKLTFSSSSLTSCRYLSLVIMTLSATAITGQQGNGGGGGEYGPSDWRTSNTWCPAELLSINDDILPAIEAQINATDPTGALLPALDVADFGYIGGIYELFVNQNGTTAQELLGGNPSPRATFGRNSEYTDTVLRILDEVGIFWTQAASVDTFPVRAIGYNGEVIETNPGMFLEVLAGATGVIDPAMVGNLQIAITNFVPPYAGLPGGSLSIYFSIFAEYTNLPSPTIILGDGNLDFQSLIRNVNNTDRSYDSALAIEEQVVSRATLYLNDLLGNIPIPNYNLTGFYFIPNELYTFLWRNVLQCYYFAHESGKNLSDQEMCGVYEIIFEDNCGSGGAESLLRPTAPAHSCACMAAASLAKQSGSMVMDPADIVANFSNNMTLSAILNVSETVCPPIESTCSFFQESVPVMGTSTPTPFTPATAAPTTTPPTNGSDNKTSDASSIFTTSTMTKGFFSLRFGLAAGTVFLLSVMFE